MAEFENPPETVNLEASSGADENALTGFKTKKELAAHLLKKGVTAKEMLKALGWPTISMPRLAKQVGMKLEKTQEGGVTKYTGIPLDRTLR